jgi:hypothetical protein
MTWTTLANTQVSALAYHVDDKVRLQLSTGSYIDLDDDQRRGLSEYLVEGLDMKNATD